MQDDMMDDIIREAAAQHNPTTSSDTGWDKMRLQLDAHLPQKKKGKRYLLLLLALLITGGGILYVTLFRDSDTGTGDNPATAQQSAPASTPGTSNPGAVSQAQSNTAIIPSTATTGNPGNTAATPGLTTTPGTNASRSKRSSRTARIIINAGDPSLDLDRGTPDAPQNTSGKTKVRIIPVTAGTDEEPAKNKEVYLTATGIEPETVANAPVSEPAVTTKPSDSTKEKPAQDNIAVTEAKKTITEKKDTTPPTPPVTAKTPVKKSRRFANNFAITLTGGIDLSYVRTKDPGKRAFVYGAGLSYTIGKHLRLGAGFYVTDKIYAADPTDYHPPADFWTAYPDLTKVDANCRVQEIPVSIAYHFGFRPKHSWFAGVGVSSILMKTEDYTYLYKLPNGQFRGRKWYYENENEHFLSTLTLSGGYQYKLNKRISFLAEPYLKLPLKGIGFGRIRLNSIGMAVTAVVRPF